MLTLVTTIICTWLNAQTISNGLMGNVVVNTEGGNRFELSYYSENGINVVRICDWYSKFEDWFHPIVEEVVYGDSSNDSIE